MFIEVPRGITKLQILFDTPAFFSTHSMVTGSVAAEELVEKAVKSAGVTAFKWVIGLIPKNLRRRGRTIIQKKSSPPNTVMKK